MANRRPNQAGGRRSDFGRNDRGNNYGRVAVSPWQGGGPGSSLPSLLPLATGSTEATLALASNIINLLQPQRQNAVPSLLDMPIRRDFNVDMNRYNRGFVPNKMGNQGNFRRTGTYNRSGERIDTRRPNRPGDRPRQQYRTSPRKDTDFKAKPARESSQEGKEGDTSMKSENDAEKSKEDKNRYSDVDPKLLVCHICNKSMWDGRSFENHLNGRAHAIMMQKTAESYALTADTMRQEFKIREMKRTRKAGKQTPRDFYCAMCDMYAADGPEHRTTVGHRKLKKYLHPPCISCHKEMPTRIELDEHRLTADHMKKIQGKQDPANIQPESMQIYTLSMEQAFVRESNQRRRYGRWSESENKEKNKEGEAEVVKDGEEGEKDKEATDKEAAENGGEENTEEKTEQTEKIDSENTILDYKEGDDLTNLTSEMVPEYSSKRGVGRSYLSEFRCVQCKLCNKLLDSEETAEVHLKTWRHHRLFTRMLMKHIEPEVKVEQTESNKRPLPTDESGNWKRRKTTQSENEDDQNGLQDEDEEIKDDDNAGSEAVEEEVPLADEQPADETINDVEEKIEETVEIKKEKDPIVEEIEEVRKEIKKEKEEEVAPVEEKKAKPSTPATRGRGRGRRSRI